jgi:hypothetical protein
MTISTEELRRKILQAFDDEELTFFCYDTFRPVHDRFSTGMTRTRKVQLLIEHCERPSQWPLLLEKLHEQRPDTFPAPTATTSTGPTPTSPPPTTYQPWPSLPPLKPLSTAPTSGQALRIFLGYAPDDKAQVQHLYHRLRGEGFAPWMDEEDLLPGQNVRREVPRAVQQSNAVIICLSHSAVVQPGPHQTQINLALDEAKKQPEGTIFLIPLKLDACELPDRMRDLFTVNLFEPGGYEKLVRALRAVGS